VAASTTDLDRQTIEVAVIDAATDRKLRQRAAAGSSPAGVGCSTAHWTARHCSRSVVDPGRSGSRTLVPFRRDVGDVCAEHRVRGVGVQVSEQPAPCTTRATADRRGH
jgi:hypothetical protein